MSTTCCHKMVTAPFTKRLALLVAHGTSLERGGWRFIHPHGRDRVGLLTHTVKQAVHGGLIGQRSQCRNISWRAAKASACQEMARLIQLQSQGDRGSPQEHYDDHTPAHCYFCSPLFITFSLPC